MTVAEQLELRGYKRAEQQVLLAQLHSKFSSLPAQTEKLIEKRSPEQLRNWLIRILTATTLRDIFGEDLIDASQDNA